MDKAQFESLNKSLKKAFSSVADDVGRLRKRDSEIREELLKISEKINDKIAKDEFYRIVRRLDEDMKETVQKDHLDSAEQKLKLILKDATDDYEKKFKKLEDKFKDVREDNNKFNSEVDKRVKEIKNEFSKTENLKKEVKEVSKIKKSLTNLDERYAQQSKMESCFDEIDELYELVENIESASLRKEDLETFKKEIFDRLKKFEDRIKDAEEVEDELIKKTKDFYSLEKQFDAMKKEFGSIKQDIKKVDNTKEINQVHLELLKEIGKLDTRTTSQKERMKDLNDKLTEVVKVVNKESSVKQKTIPANKFDENFYDSKNVKSKIKKLEKKTDSPKESVTDNRTFWQKVADWFTEEIEEEDTKEAQKKEEKKPSQKKTSNNKSKKVQKKTMEKTKKNNKDDKKEDGDKEKQKSFLKKVVDWFTEEVEE